MKHIKQLQQSMLILAVIFTANVSAVEYTTYYFNNAQGSPIAATNDAGKVIWKKEHTPYGATYGNADDKANRIGFTGHVEEEHFNLVYMQQRWYDPAIGRFYSVDPVGFSEQNPMSFNRYAYANNNPYKFVDPDGRASLTTDKKAQTTTFDPRPENPNGKPITITTKTDVASKAKSGAADAYTTDDVNWVETGTASNAYGPNGAYIDTGDKRGRDIHGGGTGLTDPYAEKQGWKPTLGCTRGQNEDVQKLGEAIKAFKTEHPNVKIPYTRSEEVLSD